MRLLVLHYHLRPGGVRRVIELALPHLRRSLQLRSVVLAAGEAPDDTWLQALRDQLTPIPLELRVIPALGYFSEARKTPATLRRQLSAGLRALPISAGETVVWAHNLGLGRNLLFTRELTRLCASRNVPLLAHQHDWWFDNRWQRWPELRRCGFPTLRSVAETVLPASGPLVHLTINREDAGILQAHFPDRLHWVPNLAEPAPLPTPDRLRNARRWLREQLGTAVPVWLLPCRLLRRKNVAEALLLTRWLRPEAWLVTTGGASSAEEIPYTRALAEAAQRHRWPLRLGILAGNDGPAPGVPELLAASEAVLLTSIQEGFGLPNLEAAATGRPLICRRLPNIAPDLAEFGFRFPQSYDEIRVPTALFDLAAEIRRQQSLFRAWLRRIPADCRRSAGTPALLDQPGEPVAFSRLTLSAQLEVLAHPAAQSWKLCAPLNPFLGCWRDRAQTGGLLPSPWPREAKRWLSGQAYGTRFAQIVHASRPVARPAAVSGMAQREFIRARLDAAHLYPLLWAPET